MMPVIKYGFRLLVIVIIAGLYFKKGRVRYPSSDNMVLYP